MNVGCVFIIGGMEAKRGHDSIWTEEELGPSRYPRWVYSEPVLLCD